MPNAAKLSAMLTTLALMACPAVAASPTDADPLGRRTTALRAGAGDPREGARPGAS